MCKFTAKPGQKTRIWGVIREVSFETEQRRESDWAEQGIDVPLHTIQILSLPGAAVPGLLCRALPRSSEFWLVATTPERRKAASHAVPGLRPGLSGQYG